MYILWSMVKILLTLQCLLTSSSTYALGVLKSTTRCQSSLLPVSIHHYNNKYCNHYINRYHTSSSLLQMSRRSGGRTSKERGSRPPMEPYVRKDGMHLVNCFPDRYDELLKAKTDRLKELVVPFWTGSFDVYESPRINYRMRSNFNIYRDDNKSKDPAQLHYIQFDEEKKPCEITSFPRGTIRLNELMTDILAYVKTNQILSETLFEVRVVTTQSNDSVVVMIYKRPLTDAWKVEADILADKLETKIVGRSKGLKVIAGKHNTEIIEENYTVNGKTSILYQVEGAFSQPNAKVCEKMLEWSMDCTKESEQHDLLELYCGGGTFTVALASNFRQVVATELSKTSVELALQAIKANNITNIKIARLSSEEFTEAYLGKRVFTRLNEVAGIKLADYNIQTVLVDPPRAGLDAGTCELISKFNKIVYVSCNPETLARDLITLSKTHNVIRAAAFDQFPYTHHLECGVCLIRKADSNSGDSSSNNNNNNNDTKDSSIDSIDGDNIAKRRKLEE